MKKSFTIAVISLFLDQLIKTFLTNFMYIGESIVVIKNFFNISLVLNKGAAFSILMSRVTLLIIISIVALSFLGYYIIKSKNIKNYEYVIYGFLMGGTAGNLIDRVIRGAVVDYLDFNIFGYAFPIFNFADICIVVSMVLFIINMIRDGRNEVSSRHG